MRKLGLVDKNKPSGEPEKIPWDENKLVLPGRIEEESKRVPGRVFPYIRCSHVKSLESGLGLACQEQAVVAYSQQLKEGNDLLEIQDVFADEAVSAFSKSFAERPSGRVISEQLKTGDHVVVYRLDRAWRSLGDATQTIENWISNGIHVHLVADGVRSDDPFGRLHFYTMAYISWVESYLTSCRSKAVAAYLKKKGRPAGNTPYLTKKIVKNNKKQLVLDVDRIGRAAWFKDLKERTGMTYEAMAEYIAREYAKRSGKKYKMTEHPFDFRRIEKDVVALPKMLETAAANMADVPTPEELHSRGVIKYML